MECEYKVSGNALCVVLPHELDHHVASKIAGETDMLVSAYRIRQIVFDFRMTEFMDSSGVGVILGRYRNASFFGGKILAKHANPRVKKLLSMAGLSEIICDADAA